MNLLHEYSVKRRWYKLFDNPNDPRKHEGATVIERKETNKLNEIGYGIFWENNLFEGSRKAENVKQVLSWAIDIDEGTKEQQRERIKKFLTPSCVIESKNGYHCYWYTDDQEPDSESYRSFVEDYFLENLIGDPKAKDVARILRVPNTRHMKNASDPFTIEIVFDSNKKYDKRTIKKHFPQSQRKKKQIQAREAMRSILVNGNDKELFQKIYDMDHMAALERLSGSDYVNGEEYTFKKTTRGNYNILTTAKL